MKGSIPKGSQTGGDMGFAGRKGTMNARNIRRLMKKFPNDVELLAVLQQELDKYMSKDGQ